jgi:plasmid maintenance system killer protein
LQRRIATAILLANMNIIFKDDALLEIYQNGKTKDSKYKQFCRKAKLVNGYIKAVKVMYNVESTECLKNFSFLHYEKLKHNKKSSIRIVNGEIERLIFTENEEGIEVELIEIDNTHYGNK